MPSKNVPWTLADDYRQLTPSSSKKSRGSTKQKNGIHNMDPKQNFQSVCDKSLTRKASLMAKPAPRGHLSLLFFFCLGANSMPYSSRRSPLKNTQVTPAVPPGVREANSQVVYRLDYANTSAPPAETFLPRTGSRSSATQWDSGCHISQPPWPAIAPPLMKP
jgi:hypothetical protein